MFVLQSFVFINRVNIFSFDFLWLLISLEYGSQSNNSIIHFVQWTAFGEWTDRDIGSKCKSLAGFFEDGDEQWTETIWTDRKGETVHYW